MTDGQRRTCRAAATAATILLAALTAACSGGGSPGAGVASVASHPASSAASASPAGSGPASAVAFSHCMRAHGVVSFPDPDSSGALPKVGAQQLGVSASRFESAQSACSSLLQPTNAQVQSTLSGMEAFARCMRAHAVHEWPDPTTDSSGDAVFDLRSQINPDSPQVVAASDICAPLLHPAPGQNGTVLCNGIGEDGCHHYG